MLHGTTQAPQCWDRVRAPLEERGHRVWTVDFPVDQPDWAVADYVRDAVWQVDGAVEPVVVGHSGGGMLLSAVGEALGARHLVWVASLVPDFGGRSVAEELAAAGEEMFPPEWHTWTEPVVEDPAISAYFLFHDCDLEALRWALTTLRLFRPRAVFSEAPAAVGPSVGSTYVVPTADRTLRPEWMRRAAEERLGAEVVEVEGGDHCPHVSRASWFADLLVRVAS